MKRIRGNTTVLILIIITGLAAFVGAALTTTLGTARLSQRSRAYNQDIDVGLATFQLAYADWRYIGRQSWGSGLSTSSLSPVSTMITSNTSAISGTTGVTISNFTIVPTTPQLTATTTATKASGMNPSYSGYYYLASLTASKRVTGGTVSVNMSQVMVAENVSPWSYAIFYNDPLEIEPGPQMMINGSVHTNGELYTPMSTLTLAGQTSYSNGWSIGFMDGDGQHDGDTPASPSYSTNSPPTSTSPVVPFGFDGASLFQANNPNTSDDWRELIDIPNTSYSDPLASDRYYNQAYVKILVGNNNALTIIDQSGAVVSSHSTGNDANLYTAVTAAVTTNQTIYDGRQQANVRLAELNIGTLTTAVNAGKLSGFNGVVYMADTSASGTSQRGIELINGQVLPSAGLTVVSQNPVYVQGDYNTGSGTPGSDSGTPTSPTVSGYTRAPAVIAGDAVNVLSNAWVNSNSTASLSSRNATNTTVNAAFLAGIVPTATVGNNYSGGAENFPRFLENWGSATFTYYGSMVELYPSEQATGIWGNSNVYGAPTRQWYFDTNFLSNPPPGGLTFTNYSLQRWYTY